MKSHLITLLTIGALFISNSCLAQTTEPAADSTIYHITTKDGNTYIGTIVERSSQSVVIATNTIGTITIPIDQISEIKEIIGSMTDSRNWPHNFQSSNYFASTSAYGLKKGEGFYQNTWIFFNNFSYGVTDNFSIGAGVLATFFFTPEAPVWLTARLTTPVVEDKLNVGIGGVYGTLDGETFGYLYGMSTIGSRDANFTIGAGSGFVNEDFSDLFLTFAGSIRASRNFYLLLDGYAIENTLFAFIGGRSMLGRASLEYGLLTSSEFSIAGIPILGVTIPLHKK
ncbi:hypothetical protein [Ekhidna sp.]|uniref:hypothetical protein n=1 Tax=Ekhidna sp. TaxID=2608089 RepID=UPI003510D7FD